MKGDWDMGTMDYGFRTNVGSEGLEDLEGMVVHLSSSAVWEGSLKSRSMRPVMT